MKVLSLVLVSFGVCFCSASNGQSVVDATVVSKPLPATSMSTNVRVVDGGVAVVPKESSSDSAVATIRPKHAFHSVGAVGVGAVLPNGSSKPLRQRSDRCDPEQMKGQAGLCR